MAYVVFYWLFFCVVCSSALVSAVVVVASFVFLVMNPLSPWCWVINAFGIAVGIIGCRYYLKICREMWNRYQERRAFDA